jgi:hypothetical protein
VADDASTRRFIAGFAGAVVGVASVLFAYDRFVVQPREALAAPLHLEVPGETAAIVAGSAVIEPGPEAVAAETALLPPDAAPPGESVGEIAGSIVEGTSRAGASLASLAGVPGRGEAAREALAKTGMYRVAISEVYLSTGQWPASAEAAGVPPYDASAGGAVQAIEVRGNGVVVMTLREPFAPGSRFVLTPSAGADMSIRWSCRGEGEAAGLEGCTP